MKIKAFYHHYTLGKRKVCIVDFRVVYKEIRAVVIDEKGEVFDTDFEKLQIIDQDIMEFINEKTPIPYCPHCGALNKG